MNQIERRTKWEALLTEFEVSGRTVNEFCQAKEINHWTLKYWRRRLRGKPSRLRRSRRSAFVQARAVTARNEVRVELPGGVGLMLERLPEPSWFGAVIRELQTGSER